MKEPVSKGQKILMVILIVAALYFLMAFIPIHSSKVYVGSFAGECAKGMCKSMYTISSDKIIINRTSDDTLSNAHKVIQGNFDTLKFRVPLLLVFHLSGKFGCPDCTDGGGYTLGFRFLGMNWYYNLDKGSEPWYFKDMANVVSDRLQKIEVIEGAKDK